VREKSYSGLKPSRDKQKTTMAEETSNGFPEKEGVTEIELLAQKLTRSAENCSDTTLRELEKLKLKTEENYAAALDQIAANMAAWRSLLDEKEAVSCLRKESVIPNSPYLWCGIYGTTVIMKDTFL
jgi:hypothetical protein